LPDDRGRSLAGRLDPQNSGDTQDLRVPQPFARNGQRRAFIHCEIRSFTQMLWTIAVILFVLWALGLATAYTMSGLIHILLVLAIVVVLIRVIQGRRVI
jgi:hypothetical protein